MAEIVYPPVIATARLSFRLLDLKITVTGGEHVPRVGGGVLASNHVSYLDFIFCGYAAQPSNRLVRFMAKDAVFRHRIAGPLMRGMKHIPVDRDAGSQAYRDGLTALRSGEIIGVFPEATISRAFELKGFKSGAARMAAAADVPLIPMITWGGQRMFTKDHPREFPRHHQILLTVGEPLRPSRSDDAEEVTAELRRRMDALLVSTLQNYALPLTQDTDRWWWPVRFGGTAPTLEAAAVLDTDEKAARKSSGNSAGGRSTDGGIS